MKRFIIVLFVAAVIIGGLFFVLKPDESKAPTSKQPSTTKTFNLAVKDKKLVSGGGSLKANQGDAIIITITLDEADELHLHGYDKMLDLEKDKPGTLKFTADQAGHFPLELHHAEIELGALEVSPK